MKRLWIILLLAVFTLSVSVYASQYRPKGESNYEIQILGANQYLAGSPVSLRVVTFIPGQNTPVSSIPVAVRLISPDAQKIYQGGGATDRYGSFEVKFQMPEEMEGKADLMISVGQGGKIQEFKSSIEIKKEAKIYLTTDKPLYQPGQTIHIRSLALRIPTLKPEAGKEVLFEIEDAKGNKVFKKKIASSKFGIAFTDFVLADEVNMGVYHLRAVVGKAVAEKAFEVKKYVLPKFKLDIKTGKNFYSPGEHITGRINTAYFFGKPVNGGKITISLYTFDVEYKKAGEIIGTTDKEGNYSFDVPLPSYFIGQPVEKGSARVRLDFEITDKAEHTEKKTITLPVVKDVINVELYPESGQLKPDLENTVYLLTTYPDGTPAEASLELTVEAQKLNIETDKMGWASFTVKPRKGGNITVSMNIEDKKGNKVSKSLSLSSAWTEENIILRADRAVYKVGGTMNLQVLSTHPSGNVYVDVIRNQQVLLTKTIEIKGGQGNLSLDITPDMAGMIAVNAYRILPTSDIVRDTKNIYVNSASDLVIKITSDKEQYLPATDAAISFLVKDSKGNPVYTALGVDIVDEAVFALGDMKPGIEKVYFLLEKELMEPKYEIHGFDISEAVLEKDELLKEKEDVTKVLFTKIEEPQYLTLNINTYTDKLNKIMQDMQKIYNEMYQFNYKHKRYPNPDELDRLVSENFLKKADIIDPWGRKYVLVKREGGGIPEIISLGPDGKLSSDDITEKVLSQFYQYRGGMGGMADGMVLREGKVMAMPAPIAAPEMPAGVVAKNEAGGAKEQVRIREYFPETLYTNPQIITDSSGRASINVKVADSITTWRLTAFGSSLNGQMGNQIFGIKVFQDFFIDIDFPVALTQNDEISIPIAIYNYLPQKQQIKLKLQKESWFELLDKDEKVRELAKDQVSVEYFRIKVKKIGFHQLTVFAYGSKMNDAIKRQIEILPDGKEFAVTKSGKLDGKISTVIEIPKEALKDASRIFVTIYPGILSQVVEGLDKVFMMPYGCFEQTSSTTYPNVLVLNYLKKVNKITPEIQMKAEGYINTGYQRLLSFEVKGGGFSWFGDAPANKILTAFGIMEFRDMAKVHEVDENVISRTQDWLVSQQLKDGSWKPDESYLHAESWSKIQNSNLPVTAYIVWALVESGEKGSAVKKGIEYLKNNWGSTNDPYILALSANAFVSYDKADPVTGDILHKLASLRKEENGSMWWETGMETGTFSRGNVANLETTALAALAFLKADGYQNIATGALNYLVKSKDPNGTWYSTQATILAMKALILAQEKASEKANATVTVSVNGGKKMTVKITPDDYDIFRQLDFKNNTVEGKNTIEIEFQGEGNCYYQVVGRYYMPWKELAKKEPLNIKVDYDRTSLEQNDMLTCKVKVSNNTGRNANMVIIDLGVPPGFEVQTSDLDDIVKKQIIKKYTMTSRQIIIYLDNIPAQKSIELSYKLRAKFPVKAKTPKSRTYQYYNPDVGSEAQPVTLEIK
ncbi:MAG: MG2 domain-containing protein [Firmicutes bacterium]|nr:MG2 domain-containing protein [Bacillota bacterium]